MPTKEYEYYPKLTVVILLALTVCVKKPQGLFFVDLFIRTRVYNYILRPIVKVLSQPLAYRYGVAELGAHYGLLIYKVTECVAEYILSSAV